MNARIAALVATLGLALPSLAAESPRVTGVRVGAHADFERIVLELDGAARVERIAAPETGSLALRVAARPPADARTIETRRAGALVIDAGDDAFVLRLAPGVGRVRVFLLERPFRVVVDVASPGPAPLEIPAGASPVPETAPAAEPPAPEPQPQVVEPSPAPEPEPEPEPPTPEPDPAPEPPPAPAPRPEPAPPERAPQPAASEVPRGVERFLGAALAFAAGAFALAGLMLFGLARRRRRRAAREESSMSTFSESPVSDEIRPSEIIGAADRLEILEKRLDEEVRARAHVEERVALLNEELKVLRDRVNRLAKG